MSLEGAGPDCMTRAEARRLGEDDSGYGWIISGRRDAGVDLLVIHGLVVHGGRSFRPA